MIKNANQFLHRLSAFLLAVLVMAGALLSNSMPVHAADGTINYHAGENIPYGSYSTSRMTFDGSNTAYCVEPKESTPPSGTYSYNLLDNSSPLRKALYYLNGGYGYDKHILTRQWKWQMPSKTFRRLRRPSGPLSFREEAARLW